MSNISQPISVAQLIAELAHEKAMHKQEREQAAEMLAQVVEKQAQTEKALKDLQERNDKKNALEHATYRDPRFLIFNSRHGSERAGPAPSWSTDDYWMTCLKCNKGPTSTPVPSAEVTRAHIVVSTSRHNKDYALFSRRYNTKLDPTCERNFIPLCGTLGAEGACLDKFDRHECTLMYCALTQSHYFYDNLSKATPTRVIPEIFRPYRRLLAWRARHIATKNVDAQLWDLAQFCSERASQLGADDDDECQADSTSVLSTEPSNASNPLSSSSSASSASPGSNLIAEDEDCVLEENRLARLHKRVGLEGQESGQKDKRAKQSPDDSDSDSWEIALMASSSSLLTTVTVTAGRSL